MSDPGERTPSVAVLGPGGVGGLVAAALDRDGADVTLVAREETAMDLAQRGITVDSRALGRFEARPRLASRVEHDVDVLIVATKAVGLEDAVARIAGDAPRLVVPLLNGVDHMAVLRERFGTDVVRAAVIRVASDRPRTGEIVHTSPGVRCDVAGPEEGLVAGLAGVLRRVGFEVRTGASEADVLWGKLCRLNPLACATTAFDAPVGAIRDDPSRASALFAAVEETVAAAHAEGADVDAATARAEVEALDPAQCSSMARDVAAGRPAEVDAIPGAVRRAARRHGQRTPALDYLVERIEERIAASGAA